MPHEVFEFAVGTDDVTVNNWGYRMEPNGTGTKVTEYFRLEPALPCASTGCCSATCAVAPTGAACAHLERMKAVLES